MSKKFEGDTAKVEILDDNRVVLKPENPTFGYHRFRDKIDKLRLLKEIVTNTDGVTIPAILQDKDTEVIVERAEGINLTEIPGSSQGAILDFLSIPTEIKLIGAVRYLQVVAEVDKSGRAIIDHKADSIFIKPNGSITIVDGGVLDTIHHLKPMNSEINTLNQSLVHTLECFFSREVNNYALTLMPAGFVLLFRSAEEICRNQNGPDKLIAEVQKYMQDTTPIPEQKPALIGNIPTDLWHEGMTQFQYDLAFADAWRNWEIDHLEKRL
jgi:hypothetical protein